MLVTGASGAVGSAVAKKLLKCGVRKLVLFVRDKDNLDPKIKQILNAGTMAETLYVETIDF